MVHNGRHDDAPACADILSPLFPVLVGHGVHVVAPVSLYVFAGHGVHIAAPASLYVPAGHVSRPNVGV